MECLNHEKILDYVEKNLGTVENAIIRDHFIVCEKCRSVYEQYLGIETALKEPVLREVPQAIEKFVLRKLFSRMPTYTSVIALVAASFVFLISWIYIYFDFANNSLIQALKMTSSSTSRWLSSVIHFISTVFTAVFSMFKAINKFFEIAFKINMGAEIVSLITLLLTLSLFYGFYRLIWKKKTASTQTSELRK